jgi:hypothetical protein
MITPPYDHSLNLTTQAILTFASWAIALGLLAASAWRGYRQKTVFPVLLVLSAAVAALAEPLYDIGFKLLFFIPGQWTLFIYGDIPQPVWTVSGYTILYAGPAIFICEALARGISRRTFLTWAAATLLASSVFEIYGIAGGAYTYWGAHALRIFGYPLAVGVLETTFVLLFSVFAHEYRNRIANGWGLLGLFVLFPATFYGVNFGIGAPMLVTLGLASPSPALSIVSAAASIGIAVGVLVALAGYVAAPLSRTEEIGAPIARAGCARALNAMGNNKPPLGRAS